MIPTEIYELARAMYIASDDAKTQMTWTRAPEYVTSRWINRAYRVMGLVNDAGYQMLSADA